LHIGVITMYVVNVVGCQERCVETLGNLNQEGVGAYLISNTVVLQLNKEVIAPKDVL
jgi:hypothetical protein